MGFEVGALVAPYGRVNGSVQDEECTVVETDGFCVVTVTTAEVVLVVVGVLFKNNLETTST